MNGHSRRLAALPQPSYFGGELRPYPQELHASPPAHVANDAGRMAKAPSQQEGFASAYQPYAERMPSGRRTASWLDAT
jgi:hypothetical protein